MCLRFLIFCAWGGLLAGVADGQPINNDYYESGSTALLGTVERYHLGPGEEKMRAKRYEAAFGDFKFILNYFPNHPQALLLMAQLCAAWKSPTCVTRDYFDAALARNPSTPTTYVAYGIYLLRARQPSAAIKQLNRALDLAPDSMNAHYNLALAYLDIRDYERANEHAQAAYALGATLPGLRDRLKRDGHWNPTKQPPSAGAPSQGAAPGAAELAAGSASEPLTMCCLRRAHARNRQDACCPDQPGKIPSNETAAGHET